MVALQNFCPRQYVIRLLPPRAKLEGTRRKRVRILEVLRLDHREDVFEVGEYEVVEIIPRVPRDHFLELARETLLERTDIWIYESLAVRLLYGARIIFSNVIEIGGIGLKRGIERQRRRLEKIIQEIIK